MYDNNHRRMISSVGLLHRWQHKIYSFLFWKVQSDSYLLCCDWQKCTLSCSASETLHLKLVQTSCFQSLKVGPSITARFGKIDRHSQGSWVMSHCKALKTTMWVLNFKWLINDQTHELYDCIKCITCHASLPFKYRVKVEIKYERHAEYYP